MVLGVVCGLGGFQVRSSGPQGSADQQGVDQATVIHEGPSRLAKCVGHLSFLVRGSLP